MKRAISRLLLQVSLPILLLSLPAPRCSAATLVVDPGGGGDHTGIQSALYAANSGDEIIVKSGEYLITEPINFQGKEVTVRSESGSEMTTIRFSDQPADPNRVRVVIFESGETPAATLEGFTLRGARGQRVESGTWEFTGGGVLCINNSSPTLRSCAILDNSAWLYGGGVACAGNSNPILTDCMISGNFANNGGGLYCKDSSPVLTNCTISENEGGGFAGGVYCNDSSPTMTDCTISGNVSEEDGGGFWCGPNSSPTLTNCTISGNEATEDGGGGIYCVGPGCSPVLENCRILENFSEEDGAGIHCGPDSSPEMTNCTVSGNGGVFRFNLLFLRAGGVFCGAGSTPTLTGCTISENWAQQGGGMYCERSSAKLIDCTISGNYANRIGGLYCQGVPSATLRGCTISGNSSEEGGAGVHCEDGSPAFTGCTVSGNWTRQDGGGVFCDLQAAPDFTNCIVFGNLANRGGGLFCGDSSATLTNCTVAENSAKEEGGGAFCLDSSPIFTNCIIWGNGPDNGACGVLDHCIFDVDPHFLTSGAYDFELYRTEVIPGILQYFLPEFILQPPDYDLATASPCIDAGTPEGAPPTDIGGRSRPCGEGVDIGAYEYGNCTTTPFRRGDVDGNGEILISDPISLLWYLYFGGQAPGCLDAADADDNGEHELSDAIHVLTFLFLGGSPPASPFPDCGPDASPSDSLDCQAYNACP